MGLEQFAMGVQQGFAPAIQQGMQQQAADKGMQRDLLKLRKVHEMQFKAQQVADEYQFGQKLDRMGQALGQVGVDPGMAGIFATGIDPTQAGVGPGAEFAQLRLRGQELTNLGIQARTDLARARQGAVGQGAQSEELRSLLALARLGGPRQGVRQTQSVMAIDPNTGQMTMVPQTTYGPEPSQPFYDPVMERIQSILGVPRQETGVDPNFIGPQTPMFGDFITGQQQIQPTPTPTAPPAISYESIVIDDKFREKTLKSWKKNAQGAKAGHKASLGRIEKLTREAAAGDARAQKEVKVLNEAGLL